jgi:glucosamine-6-phosphate deaminase
MTLQIFDNATGASDAVARVIARRLRARPATVLGLPTGRTAVPVYDALVGHQLNFSRVHIFNLDEFVGVRSGDPRSFRAFMNRHLFDRVNIAPRNIHFLNGVAKDLAVECRRFERAIAAAGGLDLVVLGIGANGHIGFNEPDSGLRLRTHTARLTTGTRRANAARFGGKVSAVPREALSMGIGTILAARAIVLVATGVSKARAIRQMRADWITPALPASFLQLHPDVRLIVDRAAAAGLDE